MSATTTNGLVGRIALAKLAGVHPDRVSKYTQDGMPVVTRGGHGHESAYDPVAALAWIAQRREPSAKEAYYREIAERERRANALRAGETCERAAVLSAIHALIGEAKNALLGLPSKVKTAEPSVSASVCLTIDRLVREMLDELADGLEAVPPTPAPLGVLGQTPPAARGGDGINLQGQTPENGRPARRSRRARAGERLDAIPPAVGRRPGIGRSGAPNSPSRTALARAAGREPAA